MWFQHHMPTWSSRACAPVHRKSADSGLTARLPRPEGRGLRSQVVNIPEERPKRSVDEKGNILWKLNGKLHNPHGPALIRSDGDKEWFTYGKRNRIGKPAIERPNGSTYWFVDDKLHRTDGPSIEHPDGTTYWDVDGIRTKNPALCKKAILPDLTDEEFYKLCTHKDYVVRQLAAHNPHCPEEWRILVEIMYG